MDLELEARFPGVCEVLVFDEGLYADEHAVDAFIKTNCPEIFTKCLKEDWPSGTPAAGGTTRSPADTLIRSLPGWG